MIYHEKASNVIYILSICGSTKFLKYKEIHENKKRLIVLFALFRSSQFHEELVQHPCSQTHPTSECKFIDELKKESGGT